MKKFFRKIYFKYFAKIQFHTVHLRGGLNQEEQIFFENHPKRLSAKELFKKALGEKRLLEIGFGDGKFLLNEAKKNLENIYIGLELDKISIYKLLKKVDKENLANIFLICEDARTFVNKIPDKYFQKIFVTFPDPWPKKREQKRRLLNREFILKILEKISETGEINIATDIESYQTQIEGILLSLVEEKKIFFTKHDDTKLGDYKEIFNSKFAKKAKVQGRKNVLFSIKKV